MRRGRPVLECALGVVVLMAVIATGASWPPGAQGQRRPGVGQPAPEISGGPWLNSEPLSVAGLRGRVVFVEFWTYG